MQHKGATRGPRPELRQEMMAVAGVQYYMYTTPRFLEFANQFLSLSFDTKKAETEFEEIEKQDKQAASALADYLWTDFNPSNNLVWQNWNWLQNLNLNQNVASKNPSNFPIPVWLQSDFAGSDVRADPPAKRSEELDSNSSYLLLLPVNGHVFHSSTGKWKCEIISEPIIGGTGPC